VRLYLVQHGEAKKEEEDPARPLTDEGFRDCVKVAKYISGLNIRVKKVFHSGKLRAKQTAEVYAEYLKPEEGVMETDGLKPLAETKLWVERAGTIGEDAMVVGHLPQLSKLTSALIIEDESREVIRFRNAGVVCLERDEQGKWRILWAITPKTISGSG